MTTLDDTQPLTLPPPRGYRRPLGVYVISYGCGDHYWRCETTMLPDRAQEHLDWWAEQNPNVHFVLRWHGMLIADACVIV